jgi:hypothetical protein
MINLDAPNGTVEGLGALNSVVRRPSEGLKIPSILIEYVIVSPVAESVIFTDHVFESFGVCSYPSSNLFFPICYRGVK